MFYEIILFIEDESFAEYNKLLQSDFNFLQE